MKEISDDQILARIAKPGTLNEGFRMLVEKYQERLYWTVRKMVIAHEDADDVVQNAFIKIYKSIDRFERKSKLYTWMYRIATNEAITFINKKKRQQEQSIFEDEERLANTLKADVFFDGDDACLKLQLAVAKLPDKQQKVFRLRYYEEYSYQEMSELLGTSVGALKASYHHAVKKIESFFRETVEK